MGEHLWTIEMNGVRSGTQMIWLALCLQHDAGPVDNVTIIVIDELSSAAAECQALELL